MRWSFYDPATGLFSGKKFRGIRPSDVEANTPEGLIAIEGEYDHRCQRILPDGQVVDWKPPKPDDDHEWNGTRWILTVAVAAVRKKRRDTQAEIENLERSQLRSMREVILDSTDDIAKDRLSGIERQIAILRAGITEVESAP